MQTLRANPTALLTRINVLPEHVAAQHYRFYVFANHFYLFAIFAHALFILLFTLLGAQELALFNVASVLVYIVALRFNLRGALDASLTLATVEVLAHTLLAAHSLGNTVFSHVPMLLAMLVFLSTSQRRWLKVLLGAMIAFVYCAANFYAEISAPAVALSPVVLSAVNLLIACGGVFAASYMGHYYSTAAARAEAALQQRGLDLQARNEELDAFAHTAAHDLKAPLYVMMAYSELLESHCASMTTDELRAHLHTIRQSTRKMNNIIDELLLLASVRTLDSIEVAPLDMASIVAEAQRRLAYLIEGQQVEIALPVRWPEVLGYAPWVEEVWVNYLSNAILYGGRPARVEVGATELPDGMVRFWVRDNGPGLTAGEQSQLFLPFTRLEQSRATGQGLGLSIVRRIVEKLDGQVGVESEIGQGSTFSFTLKGAAAAGL